MRPFRRGTRRRLFILVLTLFGAYSIWKSLQLGSETDFEKLVNGPLVQRSDTGSGNQAANDGSKRLPHANPTTVSFNYHREGIRIFEQPGPQNITVAYRNKWVGFPDLSECNCEAALDANTSKNNAFPQSVTRIFPSDYVADSSNCTTFIHKHGFSRYPRASEEERAFPLAFSLLFHKDLDQVVMILRAIYRSHNVYCLSVDTKASIDFLDGVKAVVKCLPNVFVASQLENIVYSGYSRLMADIHCMGDLLKHPVPWKYAFNLPGQEFPLRTNLEFVRILKIFNGANDIEGMTGNRMLPNRYKFKHHYVHDSGTGELKLMRTKQKNGPLPHNLEIVKGSAYNTYSRAFVEFVVKDNVSRDLLDWLKTVSSPDEYFWATLHHSKVVHVPGGYTAGPPDKKPWVATYASWASQNPCATIRRRSVCIFSVEDLPHLMRRQEFFANKFYITHHPGALHCLDQFLYNLTFSGTTRDLSFYEQLPFILKNSSAVGR